MRSMGFGEVSDNSMRNINECHTFVDNIIVGY